MKITFSMGEVVDSSMENICQAYRYYPLEITVPMKRNWYNKLRFWLFFKFFPFEFRKWE